MLKESYDTTPVTAAGFYTNTWIAVKFPVVVGYNLTSVTFVLNRASYGSPSVPGNPGTITASLRSVVGGHPSGGDLFTAMTTDADTLQPAPGYDYRELILPTPYAVVSGNYSWVLRCLTGDTSNAADWYYTTPNPQPVGWGYENSNDSGSTWSSVNACFLFANYGVVGKLYPTNAITRVTSLIHVFDRLGGILNLTAGMGGVLAEADVPTLIVTPSDVKVEEGLPVGETQPDYPNAPHVSGFTGTVNPQPGSPPTADFGGGQSGGAGATRGWESSPTLGKMLKKIIVSPPVTPLVAGQKATGTIGKAIVKKLVESKIQNTKQGEEAKRKAYYVNGKIIYGGPR